MSLPLNWRGLAIVLAAHLAIVASVAYVRPSVDKARLSSPIFAKIIIPERGEPVTPDPEPRPPAVEPLPPSPPPPPPKTAEPDPTPRMAAPEKAPTRTEMTVAPAGVDPIPQSAAPAPDAATAPPVTNAPAHASLDSLPGSPDDVRKYIAAVMRQLHRHKKYPRELKKAKIEGTVVIQFTIDRDGRLIASDVKRSSGHPELDRAAMDMLARADPLPAIPDFMSRDELALAIPVEYSLITDR